MNKQQNKEISKPAEPKSGSETRMINISSFKRNEDYKPEGESGMPGEDFQLIQSSPQIFQGLSAAFKPFKEKPLFQGSSNS
mmetsp:Transcript_28988/g.33107  ORF Transcript_28988/g.33107 Transcript_28988/m.33107 type:complete len:81 (+) Transcript_28988:1414-1656(+)